jgi:predicted amidophosphoribosyltransferase
VIRLQKIDELTRSDHSYISQDDDCFYLLEYAARQKPPYDSTSDLIFNLKKPVDRIGKPEYLYKEHAIRKAGALFREVLSVDWLQTATIVPIPCSKVATDPLYDDRVTQMMSHMTQGLVCDVRELVVQTQSLESFHDGIRLPPAQLVQYYKLDDALCERCEPRVVALFDDMLTTGSHFKAMKTVIQNRCNVPVCGIFLARRYFPKSVPNP